MSRQRKFNILIFVFFLSFLILVARLVQLQIVEGKENRFQADNNRIQSARLEAPRGEIIDRHGEILARNVPQYLLDDKEISREEALNLQEQGKDLNLNIKIERSYPSGQDFTHLIGFLGEVSQKEFSFGKLELKGYPLGSLIGRSGVEAQYEDLLRGHDGSELMEVDTTGKVIRRMGEILPTAGETLTLAIDKKLQETAISAFNKATGSSGKGVVIATDPKSGEVLLYYSSPSYDPNLYLKGDNGELSKIINDEKNMPLLDRVISGLYPPGSTFKIVTSVAGLQEGKITASSLINDPGVIRIGSFTYSNWYFTSYGRTEGDINLVKALARSTDTFFYKLGEYIGIDKLHSWMQKFYLDQKTGIDLPGELSGFMATPEWKLKERNENWFLGNTYHVAIGQGDVTLTPLGVNLMTATVANGGKICTPRVLKIGAENTPYGSSCKDLGIKKEYLDLIKQGMVGACSTGGTAYPFFDFKPQVACKTGTAETGDGKTTHAWFTVMAPADNPEIVLTVLVENGGEGSTVAAPIAKEILTEYFKDR